MFESHLMFLSSQVQDTQGPRYSVGLDASLTNFGIYALPLDGDGDYYAWSVSSTAQDGSDLFRQLAMIELIVEDLSELNIVVATFEDYGPINRMAGKLTQRAEMCGILKHYLSDVRKAPVITITPPALKSFATGTSKASKDEMINEAVRRGFHPANHDEADAFFAARVGDFVINGLKTGVSFTRVNPVP